MRGAVIREARPEDGLEMLELIESQPSRGNLRVIYTRQPDAYSSYHAENRAAGLTVCADEAGRILAQAACMPQRLYIGGKATTVGYITGLHKREGVFADLPGLFAEGRRRSACELFYCSILGDNDAVFQMLQKKREFIPGINFLCDYTTFLINPKAAGGRKNRRGFTFRQATPEDSENLLAFINEEGKKHAFFPCMDSLEDFSGLRITDFYILENGEEFLACGALWDQRAFKQYVAFDYRGIYRLAARLGPVLDFLGIMPLPKVGTAAQFPQLSFFLAKEDTVLYYQIFLREIAMKIREHYSFFSLGAVSGSPADAICRSIRSIHFNSKLCLFSFDKSGGLPEGCGQSPRFECGLL